MITSHKFRFQDELAKLMLYGVLLAAAVMLAGGILYLHQHGKQSLHDHLFHGEPHSLTNPLSIVQDALRGNDADIIQLGVLLLLLNPPIRVAFAAVGYAMERDRMYAIFSAIVLFVLLFSFFW